MSTFRTIKTFPFTFGIDGGYVLRKRADQGSYRKAVMIYRERLTKYGSIASGQSLTPFRRFVVIFIVIVEIEIG